MLEEKASTTEQLQKEIAQLKEGMKNDDKPKFQGEVGQLPDAKSDGIFIGTVTEAQGHVISVTEYPKRLTRFHHKVQEE